MPIISQCPKCQQPVMIPEGVASEAEVRCPLCAAAFPMSEAMAGLPPALIPIDTSSPLSADSQTAADSGLISEPFHGPDFEPSSQADGSGEQEEAVPDMWKKVDDVPTIDTGEDASSEATPSADIDPDVLVGFALEEEGEQETPAAGESPATHVRKPRRKRRKQKSMTREILGALIGGPVGLLIGYYILMWCFDDLGLPKFDLPFLPHTMNEADDANGTDGDGKPDESESNTGRESDPKPLLTPTGQGNVEASDPSTDPSSPSDGEQVPTPQQEPNPFDAVDNDPFANPGDGGEDTDVDPMGAMVPAETGGMDLTPLPVPTVDPVPGLPTPSLPIPAISQPDPIQPTETSATPPVELPLEPTITPTVQPTEAIVEPPSQFGPVSPPSYSVAKLVETLDATDNAIGPITTETSISQEAFDALCRTGHVAAFLDTPEDETLQNRAQTLLGNLDNTESRVEQLQKLGGELLAQKDAPAQGIAIAGTVRAVGMQGGVQGIVLNLAALNETCVVMNPQAADVQQGDRLVVLGGLVRNPKERFAGYKGSRDVLIWAATVVKISQ